MISNSSATKKCLSRIICKKQNKNKNTISVNPKLSHNDHIHTLFEQCTSQCTCMYLYWPWIVLRLKPWSQIPLRTAANAVRTIFFFTISYGLLKAAVRESSGRRPFISSQPGRWSCPTNALRKPLIAGRPYECLMNIVRTTQDYFRSGDNFRSPKFLRWS